MNSSTRENLKERKTNGARGGGGEGAASIKHERQPGRGFLSVCNCKYLIKQKTTHLAHNHMLTMALGVAGPVRRVTGPPPRSNRGTHTKTHTHTNCVVMSAEFSLAYGDTSALRKPKHHQAAMILAAGTRPLSAPAALRRDHIPGVCITHTSPHLTSSPPAYYKGWMPFNVPRPLPAFGVPLLKFRIINRFYF